jgi:succinyl-diaminopimelate desuccinylase
MQKLIKKLIAFESDKNHPEEIKKCFDLVVGELKKAGLKVKTFSRNNKPSLVATLTPIKTPKIFLNGHLDVVPGKPAQFKPKIVGNRLYGRGTIDMKAAVVVMIKLMKELAQKHKNQIKDKIGLMIVSDEEIGGFDGSRFLLKKGYKPEFFLAGEPTDFKIGAQAKGLLWLKLTLMGKSAHGAYLWKGQNAIIKANQAIKQIIKLFPPPKKEAWQTTCNIATISGGKTTNQVPDQCEIKLDIRYLPEKKPDEIIKMIQKVVPEVKIETIFKEPAANCSKTNPFITKLKKSIKKATGKESGFIKKHAASDARHYSAAGVPSIAFGPIGQGQHSDSEWVDLKSLKTYYRILKDFLLSF